MSEENIALIVIVVLSICVLLIVGYMALIAYDVYSNLDKTMQNKIEEISSDDIDSTNTR